MEQKKMNNKGFSLVELIIVIAIMAILVGVLAPQFIKYVEKSRVAKDIQNIQQLKTAVEVYAAGNEGLSSAVSVTVTAPSGGNKGKVTVSLTPAQLGGVGTASGTNTDVILDSKNWSGAGSFSYSTGYVWSCSTDCTNSYGTTETTDDVSMKTIFGL